MWALPFLHVALAGDPPPPAPPPPEEDAGEDEDEPDDDGTVSHPVPYAQPYTPDPKVEPPKYQPPIARPPASPTGTPPPAATATTHYTPLASDGPAPVPATATTRYTPGAATEASPRGGGTSREAASGLLGFTVEGGYAWLAGSNAGAWTAGPSARLNVDVQDAGRYRASASWGVSLHTLDDPAAIWGPAGADASGRSQLHTIVGGGRYFLTPDPTPVGLRVVPFVGGNGGLLLTVAHLEAVGQTSSTVRVRLVVEGTGGVELRVGPAAAVTAGARVALAPLMLRGADEKLRPGGLLSITPALGAGWTF